MPPVPSLLDAARAEPDAALRLPLLLEAWRRTRAAELAGLVERHLEALAAHRPKVGAANLSFQKAWLARAAERNVADLPHLLASLEVGTAPLVKVRLEALHVFAPNPLLARVLTSWFVDTPFEGTGRALCLQPALALVEACADPRSVEVLERITRPDARLETVRRCSLKLWKPLVALAKAARGWSQGAPSLDLTGLDLPAPRPPRDLSALWAEVYDAPDEVHRKLVLADALQEAGDARGEFIALQCARAPGAKPSRREKELLAQHRFDFLGPLVHLLAAPEYEGGLLVKAQVLPHLPEAPLWHEPAWRAVQQLDFMATTDRVASAVLANPLLARLESVRGVTANELAELLPSRPVPTWSTLEVRFGTEAACRELLALVSGWPRLECLALPFNDGAAVRAALGQRLRVYGVSAGSDELPAIIDALTGSSVERVVFNGPAFLAAVDLRTRALTVYNDASDALSLPTSLQHITVVTTHRYPERTRRFIASLATLGAKVTVREGRAPSFGALLRSGRVE